MYFRSEFYMNFKVVILALLLSITVSSCVPIEKNISSIKDSKKAPSVRKTMLSGSLGCLGEMASFYNRKIKIVTVSPILDRSGISRLNDGEIPPDMTDITLTELSKVGGPLRVNYYPSSEEAEKFANLHSLGSRYKPISIPDKSYRKGTIILQGALTEYDRLILNTKSNNSIGASFGSGKGESEAEYKNDQVSTVGRMTMDFRVVSATIGEIQNFTASSNTLDIQQNARTKEFTFGIDGNTFSRKNSVSKADARHSALRLLIQSGVTETLGNHWIIPYWKCTGVVRQGDISKLRKALINNMSRKEIKGIKNNLTTLKYVNSNPTKNITSSIISIYTIDKKGSKAIKGYANVVIKDDIKSNIVKKTNEAYCKALRKQHKLSEKTSYCHYENSIVSSQKESLYKLYLIYKKQDLENPQMLTIDSNVNSLIDEMKSIYRDYFKRDIPLRKNYNNIKGLYADLWINAPFKRTASH